MKSLRLLFTNPGQELYTRELARLSFLALRTVQDELAKLESANLIVSRSNGYQRFYRANSKVPEPSNGAARPARSTTKYRNPIRPQVNPNPEIELNA